MPETPAGQEPIQQAAPPVQATPTPETPPAPSAPQEPSFLEQLKSSGIPIPDDPKQALTGLTQLWRESQQLKALAPAAREFVQNRDKYNEWQKHQEAEAAKQKKQAWYAEWHNPPEWNNAYNKLLRVNPETNQIEAVAGAPPGLVDKYQNYEAYRRQQLERFVDSPFEFIEPAVKHLAKQIAEEQIKQHIGQFQQQNTIQSIVKENESWMYEYDDKGQIRTEMAFDEGGNPFRRRVFNEWGERYNVYLSEAAQFFGIIEPDKQHKYALSMVQRDYLATGKKPEAAPETPETPAPVAPPETPRERANKAFVDKAKTVAKASPTTPPNAKESKPKPSYKNPRYELETALAADLAANGFGPGSKLV